MGGWQLLEEVGRWAGETEQLLACSESESPSLLRSHCDTDTLPGRREGGAVIQKMEGGEMKQQGAAGGGGGMGAVEEEREGGGEQDEGGGEGDEGGIGKEEIKQGKREGREERTVLNSCTLVEGLLFPVEYYVRTTRRMTSSQSQPDLHAVILSQLSRGRKRARPTTHTIHTHSVTLGTHTHSSQGTDGDHVTSELASNQRPPEASATHHMPARESVTNEDACLVSKGHIAAPMRGCLKSRKWRRGNRKGRGLGGSLSLDLLEVVAPDRPQHPAGPGPASQPLPGAPGREGQPLSGGPETKVYPIFRTSSPLQNRGVWCVCVSVDDHLTES